ncbi:MAG: efflux RND transporter periplasmic adaptor subunit [Acidobacteriota bacterium]
MTRRKKWIVGGVVVVAVAAGAAAVASRSKGPAEEKLDTPVAKVAYADVQVEVTEIGTVEPEVKVDVKSALSGKVVDLPVREGDVVRKGQTLAAIEPDVNQAQTLAAVRRGVNQQEIEFLDAEKDYKAKEELLRAGLISVELHRAAETRYKSARESLAAAQEKAGIVESSGVSLTTNPQQVLQIQSPMDGVVIMRPVEYGEAVTGAGSFNAGTVIATVADLSKMIVKAGVAEVDIGRIRLDAPVSVTLDAYPKVRFSGRVSRIAPAARLQDQVKVFDVEITLDSLGKELRTGMTANVSIKGDRADHVLAAPIEAVFRREDSEIVYVKKPAPEKGKEEAGKADEAADKGGKAEPRPTPDPRDAWKKHFEERTVETALASLSHVQIVSGLAENEEVALEDPTKPKKKENGR